MRARERHRIDRRAAEARAAFAEIPVEDGIAVVPVAEAKAHLTTLIEKLRQADAP